MACSAFIETARLSCHWKGGRSPSSWASWSQACVCSSGASLTSAPSSSTMTPIQSVERRLWRSSGLARWGSSTAPSRTRGIGLSGIWSSLRAGSGGPWLPRTGVRGGTSAGARRKRRVLRLRRATTAAAARTGRGGASLGVVVGIGARRLAHTSPYAQSESSRRLDDPTISPIRREKAEGAPEEARRAESLE